MKLLFNKTNNGSAEIKSLLGFTDGDLKFDNIKPKLFPATDAVIELIGFNLYDSLMSVYETDSTDEINVEFLRRTRSAILLDAYRNYAKDNDLSHSSNGRFNQLDDKQRLPWEWQIYNSDKKLERDYYVQLDALIKYMDQFVVAWKTTDAYKQTHNLFLRKASDYDEYFGIDSSMLLFQKLAPGIRKTERDTIVPLIGIDLYNELKTKLKTNANDIDETLLSLIKEALVYSSLSCGIPRLSVQLFPEGLLQQADNSGSTISARKSTEKYEVASLSQKFKTDADNAFQLIANYIKKLTDSNAEPLPPYERTFDEENTFVDL
jgi:hypothetical protein